MPDSLLLGLWTLSLIMAGVSLAAFVLLVLERFLSSRRQARRERAHENTISALLLAGEDHDEAVRLLVPLVKDRRTVAQSLLEYTSLVRGQDLQRAVDALREAGSEKALIALLVRGQGKYRRVAAEALGFFNSDEALDALDRTLESKAPTSVKVAATRALLGLGEVPDLADILPRFDLRQLEAPLEMAAIFQIFARENPEPLIRRLKMGGDDESLRAMMIDALGRSGVYDAIPVLETAASDPGVRIRASAIEALGNLELPISPDVIEAALADESSEVRAEAVSAVGNVGMPEYADQLETLLSDTDWNVRFGAADALLKLGPEYRGRLELAAGGSVSARAQRTASLVLSERTAA